MIKKSVVKSTKEDGTWNNKNGDIFYKYQILMANGDHGEYSSVSDNQTKFISGVEVEYVYVAGDHPKIKPHYITKAPYTYSQTNNDESKQIARSVGVKSSVDLAIATGVTDLEIILVNAKILSDFIIRDNG